MHFIKQKEALETYSFIYGLFNKGLFEGSGTYDSGSPLWQSGKVVMHPGSYWFLNAENRWKNLAFDLGLYLTHQVIHTLDNMSHQLVVLQYTHYQWFRF